MHKFNTREIQEVLRQHLAGKSLRQLEEEEIAQIMGISIKRVYAIVESFLGARNFTSDMKDRPKKD